MDQTRGKNAVMVLFSEESEEEEEEDNYDCEDSDCDEASESDDCIDLDDSSLSDKVVALLREGNDIESLKLNECKAYLRKHGLRIAGNREVCVARIKEHWRLKHGSGYTLYPRSSFTINCTGDVCMGDVVLFRQKVYEKFDKVTRHGKVLGNRTVAGRVVKESYGAAKQQHTFTVEVLWSSGVRKLPPLSPLLVKGRNLYKQKTYRQRWKNEANRIEVLREKHKRGAAARSQRALKQKKKSCYANESKGSKRQHEIHNKKRSKIGRTCVVDKDRHQDGSRRANNFQPRESTQATQNENASSRASRYTGERHKSAEFDRYQVPVNPSYASYPQSTYQYQVNSQSRNGPSDFFYHNRGVIPNMTGFPPFRPRVGEFTFRSRHLVSNDGRHAHTNLYDFDMNNYGWRKYGI
ncbi:Zinc finger CCCH domain-containing protein 62 [Spatholobus suberectus]|nr:Zinc finger CCCH domain-containing protein 62 [Spatholobus suberectus]